MCAKHAKKCRNKSAKKLKNATEKGKINKEMGRFYRKLVHMPARFHIKSGKIAYLWQIAVCVCTDGISVLNEEGRSSAKAKI